MPTGYTDLDGDLECLRYAHAGLFNEETSRWEGGGCSWNESTCTNAAWNGLLECLVYARNSPRGICPWNENVCSGAAFIGSLEILKYAHTGYLDEKTSFAFNKILQDTMGPRCSVEDVVEGRQWGGGGCPWDEDTCTNAAKCGNLECLKYAHENGCPWDDRTSGHAAATGNIECLKYAVENGCPCEEDYFDLLEQFEEDRDE